MSDAMAGALNAMDEAQAIAALMRCCGSTRWAAAMAARRPFADDQEVLGAADSQWWRLGAEDWLEAFSHHPEIGADIEKLRERYQATAAWSAGEQAGVRGASELTLKELADGNRRYRARFGHVFLVCASGKTAEQMLSLLLDRLPNSPSDELRVAAGEHAKITRLRLEKLAQ